MNVQSFLSILVVFLLLLSGPAKAESQVFTVGVEPASDPVLVAEHWMPFLRELSARSGIELRFRTSKDVLEYNRAIKNDEFDFVITTPYLMTIFAQKYAISAVAKLHHQNDFNALALVGRPQQSMQSDTNEIIVGVSEQHRRSKFASVLNQLSQRNTAHILQSYPSDAEVIESVREGLSHMGIISISGRSHQQRFGYSDLTVLWTEEQPMVSYLSASPSVTLDILTVMRNVLPGDDGSGQPWASAFGISQIELLGIGQSGKSSYSELDVEFLVDEIY